MLYHANPPAKCDLCHKPIRDSFIDGATRFGPWANMCPACHRRDGRGLGIGRGQHYVKQPDGRFGKVA